MNALHSPLYILGAGSIGLLVAASIRSKNPSFPVKLLLRPTHRARLKTYGQELKINAKISDRIILQTSSSIPIVVQHDFQRHRAHSKNDVQQSVDTYVLVAFKSVGNSDTVVLMDIPAEIIQCANDTNAATIRHILLTTKAQDASRALASVSHRLEPSGQTQILVLSNGTLALLDELRTNHIRAQLISASTTHGANRGTVENFHSVISLLGQSCFHVVNAGVGSVYIENKNTTDMSCIVEILKSSGLNPHLLSKEDMNIMHWKKLVANCTINPLTALRRVPNGQLIVSSNNTDHHEGNIDHARYMDMNILSKLVQELSQVAQAEFFESRPDALSFHNLLGFVQQVIRDTAQNRSSMLQDIENHKTTEIDYLNAYAVRLGQKHGINMDANNYILQEVMRLESIFGTTS